MIDPSPAPEHSWPAALRNGLLWVIAAAALIWLLRETYSVLMPLACALLLALGVWPLVAAIRERVPRALAWLGAVAGLVVVLAFLAAFIAGIGYAGQQLYELSTDVMPQLRERLGSLPFDVPDIRSFDSLSEIGSFAGRDQLASGALSALGTTASMVAGLVLILFLMLLMLTEADNWRAKIDTLSRGEEGSPRWVAIGHSIGAKFRAYFTTRLLVGVISGALYTLFLLVAGVEYAVLWGLLTVLLNFVPTVGSIVSGLLPTAYVFLTRDLGTAALVGAGLLVIEQVMGNFVDPKLMGRRLAISPLVVLVTLVFWSLLWGLAGALLAVPLTVLAIVVMSHFDRFKPAALLLTDCEDLEALADY